MKTIVTHSGRNILIVLAIGIGIFFLCGGYAVIAKVVEKYRVNSFDELAETFSTTDISYNDLQSLKDAFRARIQTISNDIRNLENLQNQYPKNQDIPNKLANYKSYLHSMQNATFSCPEHKSTGICPKCGGKGKKILQWLPGKCKNCQGCGEINKPCDICGGYSPSEISAKKLLY